MLLLREVPLPSPSLDNSRDVGSRSFTSARHRSRKQSDGSDDVHIQFIPQPQQRWQYDVSCQQGIGHTLSFADSTLTIRRGNARFWLRNVAWQCTPAFVIERDGWGALEIL